MQDTEQTTAQHAPGRQCGTCEGFCLRSIEPKVDAGVELSLRLGQHVRHRDYEGRRVTGIVRGLSLDDRELHADIVLDAPIVIRAHSSGAREISLWHQHVPAHELAPFDDRDELIADLLAAASRARDALATLLDLPLETVREHPAYAALDAAIAKATGSAS